jgi:hypothetical protein
MNTTDHRSTPGEADTVLSAAGAGPAKPAPAQERTEEGGASWGRAEPTDHRFAGDEADVQQSAETDGPTPSVGPGSEGSTSVPSGSGSLNLPAPIGEESGPAQAGEPAGPDPDICWACKRPLPAAA